jgi:hypothetical protein
MAKKREQLLHNMYVSLCKLFGNAHRANLSTIIVYYDTGLIGSIL